MKMKPENWPSTIYKFRDWNADFGRDPLKKFELYFSSPASFNDPFDSKIKHNYSLLNDEERNSYIQNLLSKGKQNFDNLSIQLSHQNRVQLIEMMMNDKEKFQVWAEELEIDVINKTIGIISFSLQWKNILMWSHYAKNHSGYCIGLNEAKLRKISKIEYGGLVHYPLDNKFPSVHPMMDENDSFYLKFFTKSKDWNYEEEYRIVNFIPPDKDIDSSNRLLKYNADFIDEVILGIKMNESDRKEIIDLCKNLNVKVYQAVEKNFEFEVDRFEIV
jgi:hypothetical protein